jgi:hypothetical protein
MESGTTTEVFVMSDNRTRDALRARYPYQFSRTFEYGLELPEGWRGIIEGTCEQVDALLEAENIPKRNFSWLQIKEKFGGLRMYWGRRQVDMEPEKDFKNEYLPEFIYPEVIPEDPASAKYADFQDYLNSPESKMWDDKFRIPNPALRGFRPLCFTIDRTLVLRFEESVSDTEINETTAAIAKTMLIPENVCDQISELVDKAEHRCDETCYTCGAPGRLRNGGYLVTLCDDCLSAKAH